jgi:glucan phosphoethanolaminetransferase (alkaline phosphatase superfamily)
MIYAFRYGDPPTIKYHGKNKGFFEIFLNKDLTVTGEAKEFVIAEFYYIHGWLMWGAWGLLSLLMIVSNRHLKHVWWLHMWIHRLGGTFILLITLIMGILAVTKIGEVEK